MTDQKTANGRQMHAGCSVSAIMVNWNHSAFLPASLDALLTDKCTLSADCPLEILVVDNGSTDGSPDWLASQYPDIRLIRFADNTGFAHALNHGIRNTDSPLVLSLNPDVVVRPGFVRNLIQALRAGAPSAGVQIGMAAPKLLRADDPNLLDSTGLFVDRRRRPYDRGQGEPDHGQYDVQTDVFGPCGAAALYRRDMLQDIAEEIKPHEYFDESFFAYCEDADLAWRAQLRGWRCLHVPAAVATHVRGWGDALRKPGHAPKGARGPRLALRNRYLMTVKNDAWRYAAADLPLMVAAELPRLAYAAFAAPQTLLALFDLARACPSALHKRRQIRRRQRVDDAALRRWFLEPKTRRAHPTRRGHVQ